MLRQVSSLNQPEEQLQPLKRRIAIAIPARNEARVIDACLDHVARMQEDQRVLGLSVSVLANNCDDETGTRAREFANMWSGNCEVLTVTLPPARAHAGWARRLALDAAARNLANPEDVLLCTDADSLVAKDWVSRNLDYLDQGYDAVAGRARFNPRERRHMARAFRARLAAIKGYEAALAYLRAARDPAEPWPRHFDEGGASIAVTLDAYCRIGGAPTPPLGEDRALFDAIRRAGGRVRHPTDVRVLTSPRLVGRARGGASDTLARWSVQASDVPIDGLMRVDAALGEPHGDASPLSFAALSSEVKYARTLVASARRAAQSCEPAPEVEAVGAVTLRAFNRERSA
jgi:hypothetical protein